MKERHLLFSFLAFNILILLLNSSNATGQVITVLDLEGEKLPGVEVFTKDYSKGKITDSAGQVNLSDFDIKEHIHFRFLGYRHVVLTREQIEMTNNTVVMVTVDQIIDEVVVLGRNTVFQKEIPYQVNTISIKDIRTTNSQNAADALSQHGGVYVQKSQMGGGSPVIRGFEANRVLLVMDGVRLNNAIYRSGHLQNAITVDQAMLERMEVIFGPNSLMYGSDALGGVVNFKTRNPLLSNSSAKPKMGADYYTRYSTANNEKTGHFDLSLGTKKFGSLTSFTYSSFGDLRAGKKRDARFPDFGNRKIFQSLSSDGQDVALANENPNIQIGSAYNQLDLLQKFLFIPNIRHRWSANIQISTSSDVPRYDNLSEIRDDQLRWAEWHYGPQNRLLTALDYRHLDRKKFYDQLIVIGAYQKIDEDRVNRRFGNELRSSQNEDVSVYSLTIDFSKFLTHTERWEMEYGTDIQHNLVKSNSFSKNIFTQEVLLNQLTRYASDRNILTNWGGYFYMKGKSENEKMNFSTGLRYSRTSYHIVYDRKDPIEWPGNFYDGIRGSNSAVTWSIGGTWELKRGWQIRSIVSTAFRSPNIDDLSKVRVDGEEITFPNINLKPEHSANAEITLAYQTEKFKNISVTGFYTKLKDAIVRRPFVGPQGENTWITEGDTLQIVGNKNVQNGEIFGVSSNIRGSISEDWTWQATLNYIKGKEINENGEHSPLAHIPPLYGNIGIKYSNDLLNLNAVYRYNGHKPLSEFGGSADNPDHATSEGALSWSTFNIYADYQINPKMNISLSIENILDKHYRLFASGISAPGRNIILSFRGKL